MATFAAIDFETATGSRSSACSVGVVLVDDDVVVQREERLIQPPGNEYAFFNVSLHGISARDTAAADRFEDVWPEIADLIGDRLVVAHNAAFDVRMIRQELANVSRASPQTARAAGLSHDPFWGKEIVCTMRRYVPMFGGRMQLSALYQALHDGELPLASHDAGKDVETLVACLRRCSPQACDRDGC